ncbi:hypothetical protein EJV46_16125 [Roseococcus sp. SYP-B2431]|uniref:hypothetical protein n=1 Tax=Roseococcus sp. SYP-B2431 TaxID=2496640 RepID=UPI001039DC01|nr:hypothetical protein [Roseococcus sp. SYP-B2431]TCH97643.1 hypothetical protein EJV46_16125 [Roseococcus sp. SYP-B2431]
MFYSPSLRAFFISSPGSDAVEITGADHAALLAGQTAGKEIVPGEDGHPVLQDPQAPTAAPPPLTARQLRLGLLGRGITPAMVNEAITELPDDQQAVAEIEWEYATQYLRSHPLIDQIGAAFSLTPEQIDGAWAEAAAL